MDTPNTYSYETAHTLACQCLQVHVSKKSFVRSLRENFYLTYETAARIAESFQPVGKKWDRTNRPTATQLLERIQSVGYGQIWVNRPVKNPGKFSNPVGICPTCGNDSSIEPRIGG